MDDHKVTTGDAAKIHGAHELIVAATSATELLSVDVPLQFEPVRVWVGVPMTDM